MQENKKQEYKEKEKFLMRRYRTVCGMGAISHSKEQNRAQAHLLRERIF